MASLASPTTAGAAGAGSPSLRHHREPQDAADAAAWAFYESGLVHGDEDENGGGGGGAEDEEDTEDELETAEWIRFQRARTHSRLLASRQQRHRPQQQQHQQQPQQQPSDGASNEPPASLASTNSP